MLSFIRKIRVDENVRSTKNRRKVDFHLCEFKDGVNAFHRIGFETECGEEAVILMQGEWQDYNNRKYQWEERSHANSHTRTT